MLRNAERARTDFARDTKTLNEVKFKAVEIILCEIQKHTGRLSSKDIIIPLLAAFCLLCDHHTWICNIKQPLWNGCDDILRSAVFTNAYLR
jgi:hypothetical protein